MRIIQVNILILWVLVNRIAACTMRHSRMNNFAYKKEMLEVGHILFSQGLLMSQIVALLLMFFKETLNGYGQF